MVFFSVIGTDFFRQQMEIITSVIIVFKLDFLYLYLISK